MAPNATKIMVLSYIILDNRLLMEDNQLNARTGPPAGPIQAKMAENACMGPHIGPVRALKSRANASGSSAGAEMTKEVILKVE